ncbi:MAG: TetR/AcrR family transcriptional regulator [Akkermansiaceae bacterium]|nr:TetR/AcrR family transcriptional regulator [Akkermansiaceae bacterium]
MQASTCGNFCVSTAYPGKNTSEGGSTRQRLMEAARAEFGDKGIEAATTRGIAERAGCNEVTLFRHFESKQKLLVAVVQDTSEEFLALCACRGSFSGDLLEDLTRFARVYNSSLERCEGMARAMIGESRRRPTLAKELIGDVLDPFHRSMAAYLEPHRAAGRVRADLDPMAFAEVLTSALMGGLLRRSSGLSALDRDGWIRETVEIFVRGIQAGP